MLKAAITGNIAAGKSKVCRYLEKMGYAIVSADHIAHDVINSPSVIEGFADYDVFDSSGTIDRSKMGKLVFANSILRKKLEAIMHPLIRVQINEFFQSHSDEDIVFAEIPLLFETGTEDQYDIVILVYTDDDIRLKRLMLRDNLSESEALARMKSQQSQDDKAKKATHVILNNEDDGDLSSQIFAILINYNHQKSGKKE